MGSLKLIWQKRYGDAWEERWNAWREKISEATKGDKNPMFGKHDHVHGLKRYAKEKTGKSLEEIHGVEHAKKIRARKSLASIGKNNPAYGKSYVNGGKSIKGYYKGLFFRSLLEYSFMKHLESNHIDLHTDVDYECFQVHFVFEGRDRTYKPDFYVKSRRIVYEVKPSYVLKHVPDLQLVKWNTMREFLDKQDLEFHVVTDKDFPKIPFDVAKNDSDVVWIEKTFKYFKRN